MSWNEVASWYDKIVGKNGHYFHREVILPHLKRLLHFSSGDSLLDLGCGQGILAKELPKEIDYLGVDISSNLLKLAKKNSAREFLLHDLTQKLSLKKSNFSHAVMLLSLQNMCAPEIVLENATRHLSDNGELILILNHPAFRIPRQTSWGIDKGRKIQYRRIDRYLSPLEIPIQMHPSQGTSGEVTTSYHRPLHTYINILGSLGWGINKMEEWCSDKKSMGPLSKMENRAREEFPLFLFLSARKFK